MAAFAGEQPQPAAGGFLIAPAADQSGQGAHHQMQMVGHDGVAVHLDGEEPRELPQPVANPGAAVFVILSGVGVAPAQEGAANAARNAVEDTAVGGIDEESAGRGHKLIVF